MTQPYFGDYSSIVVGDQGVPAGMQDSYGADYEILGGDPQVGAYEILGNPASPPAAQAHARSVLQNISAARAAGASYVQTQRPRREYKQVLPATSLAVAAGAVRDISLNPQRPFRIRNFRASSTHTAPFFVVLAFSIGQDNQFVAPGSIPLDLFSEVALYSIVEGQTANLGNLVTLQVQNIDVSPRDFRAAFYGTSLIMG